MSKMCRLQEYPNALQTQHRILMIDLTAKRKRKKKRVNPTDSSNELHANKGDLRMSLTDFLLKLLQCKP